MEENKKRMQPKIIVIVFLCLLVVGGVSAALISYLSNTITATFELSSPFEIYYCQTSGEGNRNPNQVPFWVNIVGDWSTALSMPEQNGIVHMGLKVDNKADLVYNNLILRLAISNSVNDVQCSHINKMEFMDTAVQPYAMVGQTCIQTGNTITYDIMLSAVPANTSQEYPLLMQFKGSAPSATYTFTSQVIEP